MRIAIGSSALKARSSGEDGFMLVAVIVMMALVLITLSIAVPVVARDLRRDKEVESMHRAQQYVRAIRLYQRKFPNQYPGSMDALEKSNNIRFLRQRYVDPLTGEANWRIIHVGENKTTVKGFFNQPLSGLNTKGAGGGLGSASQLGSGFGGDGGTTKVGSTSGLAAGFGGATVATPGSGAATAGGSAAGASSPASSSSSSSSRSGGLIMGVGTVRTGPSILEPNQQATYETWEFLYDPRIEQMYAKGAANGGLGSQNASGFGKDAATGQPNSGGSSGTNGSPGTTTAPGSTPGSPQPAPQTTPQ